jgi:hypothetical protein
MGGEFFFFVFFRFFFIHLKLEQNKLHIYKFLIFTFFLKIIQLFDQNSGQYHVSLVATVLLVVGDELTGSAAAASFKFFNIC